MANANLENAELLGNVDIVVTPSCIYMSRQSSFIFKLPLRNASKTSSVDLEARYAASESQQQEDFDRSLHEQQQEYAEEEKAQWEGEKLRAEEFDRMMAGMDATFDANEQHRDRLYLDAEARQEEIFQKGESIREAVFLEGERNRVKSFERDQDIRDKRSEWYATIRDIRFQEGRQARKIACEELERALAEQFQILLRTQEDSFTSHEQRRDEIVEKLLYEERLELQGSAGFIKFPEVSVGDLAASGDVDPSIIVQPNDSKFTPPASPEIGQMREVATEGLQVQTEQPNSIVLMSSPSSENSLYSPRVPFSGYRPTLVPSPRYTPPPQLPPTVIVCRGPSILSSNSISKEEPFTVHENVATGRIPNGDSIGKEFEGRFRFVQEQRHQIFLNKEQAKENRFQEAETTRDKAEFERGRLFRRKEYHHGAEFAAMMSSHSQRFDGRMAAWGQGESRHNQQYELGKMRRQHIFNQAMSQIQKHYTAGDNLEVDVANFMRSTVEKLDRKQRVLLQEARERQSARFAKSRARREIELRTKLALEEESHNPYNWPILAPMPCMQCMPPPPASIESRPSSRSRRRRSYSPDRIIIPRSPSRRSRSRSRSRSPPAGFDPHVLFQGIKLDNSLPLPGVEEQRRKEGAFRDILRRHQFLFERSQSQREAMFGSGIQRRRATFGMNETRRQVGFEREQRNRRERSNELEHGHKTMFREAQETRERRFLRSETTREATFRTAENSREAMFKDDQIRMDEGFHIKQEELRRACFESEEQRLSSVEAWASDLLREREQEQADLYKFEEEKRKESFRKSLLFSGLRNVTKSVLADISDEGVY